MQGQDMFSAMKDTSGFYFVDFKNYPINDHSLALGVFDSGTGGLTVLDAIIRFDKYQNYSVEPVPDCLPDFGREHFIYLADQANMPYGNYAGTGKTDLLVEHIFKDVQFLLSDKYYISNKTGSYMSGKPRVKAIVIACNTATAYGQKKITDYFEQIGFPMKVIGVIDAGSRAALQKFSKDEEGSIAVFATAGTVASGGYERSLKSLMEAQSYTGTIQIFSQGGTGLAEAIDEDINYIDRKADRPRDIYKGPDVDYSSSGIEKQFLEIYNFDFSSQKMLCDAADPEQCSIIQINDPVNYLRFHLVSLMEKIRAFPGSKPLKTIILGCTHYPYLILEMEHILNELRNYQENGEFRYRHLMAEKIHLIDPAFNTADELYRYLYETKSINRHGNMLNNSEFYISLPNLANPGVITDPEGRFTYEYKYGRNAGEIQEYVRVVPFVNENILMDVKNRLRKQIPVTWQLIEAFHGNVRIAEK